MKSKRELASEVLYRTGIFSRIQAPPSEDVARVATVYDTKLEEWRDRNLVYWPNTDLETAEIPLPAFDLLVNLMINEIEDSYGLNRKPVIQKTQIEDALLMRLRRHTHKHSGVAPVQATYY